jgi:accessory gene regulator B
MVININIIYKLSYNFAYLLSRELKTDHEQRRVYYYGFKIIIGGSFKLILVCLISLLVGSFIPTIIVAITFASIRKFAGGFHMDTFNKCTIISLLLFITFGSTAQYTFDLWPTACILAIILIAYSFAFFAVLKWVPDDNPNRPITEPDEIKKFKKQTILVLTFYAAILTLVLLLKCINFKLYILSICFGVSLEMFTVTPSGHKFFDAIKHAFQKTKKKTAHNSIL